MKLKYGPNGKKFSGLEMESETLGFFIAKLLKGDDVIILRGYTVEREDGARIREAWWKQWWISIKSCLLPPI